MTAQPATADDCSLLAQWNAQLVQDEEHRNPMTIAELEQRMQGWLAGEYRAVIFYDGDEPSNRAPVGYALYREQSDEIYLRQLFIVRERRSRGLGRHALEILRSQFWPRMKRLTVEVLVANDRALSFWRSAGFTDYSMGLEIRPPGANPA